ncbi:Phenazine biosynthesis-like protein [Burkholderia vietnamiensis]|uniref:PhzF family phenazine biosynthesis protein n=4 Tax=Burkholderia TaxID=32008 RepID=UPI0008761980|nr:PhzF family phenazine biosynthesis protein [Burkholderia vietnamiensis]MBR7998585.1 PhzF family phenazine biosynthesis protein [Burkholderia vietnamiensis]SCZ31438.1 Phenazine biosynthesis-like protein [Burkholderia vietnamiensis]SFX82321.1 Phenazine biosynthesis-like protein [Burkholderia vietnamiensis]
MGYLYDVEQVRASGPLCFHTQCGPLHAYDARRATAAPPRGAGLDDPPFRARGRRLSGAADSEETVSGLTPGFDALKTFDCRGHVVTAPSRRTGVDFVSRSFFPALGVNEVQVCVSAHCKLAPFWAGRLERRRLSALQGPPRGGRLIVEDGEDRVHVAGIAVVRARLTL